MTDEQVERGLRAIERALGARGQWPGRVIVENRPEESRKDIAAPLTALGMLCLRGTPGAQGILRRSREHLELTMLPGGVWRYYANIPWDTDDTSMCALALGNVQPTAETLLATRLPDGRFPTWVEPGWDACVDAVATAHILGVIGERPDTLTAVGWLKDVVREEAELANCVFYPDPLDTHMAITRAVEAGVESLRGVLVPAAERAAARLAGEDLPPYRRAQAILVCAAAGHRPGAAAARVLADQQAADGTWPAHTLFRAGSTQEHGGYMCYTSVMVTTALCLRALTLEPGY